MQFFLRPDGVVELRARTRDLLSLAGMLTPRRSGVSVEDMDAAVAAMFAADSEREP